MGLFSSIINMAKMANGIAEYNKNCSQNFTWDSFFSGGITTSGFAFDELPKSAQLRVMKNSALVFAAIRMLSSAFQEAPIICERKGEDGTWNEIEDHVVIRPFKTNPILSESEIQQYMISHVESCGQIFLWIIRDGFGIPQEVWPIPPDWVQIQLVEGITAEDPFRIISSYKVTPTGGQEFHLTPEEMVYMRFPDPTNLWGGISPIEAASPYLQLESKSLEFKAESLDNLKLPGPVIKTKKPLGKDQARDLKSMLRRKLGGVSDSAIVISGEDASFELLNPAEGFDWKAFSELDETRILMIFGVPPIVIGALVGLENSPWSNVGEAKRWMYTNTVAGLWKMIGTGLTRALISEADRATLRIAFDTSEVLELQEDRDAISERATAEYNSGGILRSEYREKIGQKFNEGDRVYKAQMNDVFFAPGESPEDTLTVLTDDENMIPNTVLEGGTPVESDTSASDNLGDGDDGS